VPLEGPALPSSMPMVRGSRAASKLTGENATVGSIPPSRMQTVLSSGNKAEGYAAGKGDLAELTRAGVAILTPPPAQAGMNEFARHALIRALFGVGGAAGGSYYGGRQGALEGAALGLGLPKAAGTLIRAPFVQSYLENQLARGASTSPAVAKASALAAALAGGHLPQVAQ
jgi:hypothetical protein